MELSIWTYLQIKTYLTTWDDLGRDNLSGHLDQIRKLAGTLNFDVKNLDKIPLAFQPKNFLIFKTSDLLAKQGTLPSIPHILFGVKVNVGPKHAPLLRPNLKAFEWLQLTLALRLDQKSTKFVKVLKKLGKLKGKMIGQRLNKQQVFIQCYK